MFIYFVKTNATNATKEVTDLLPWAFEQHGTLGAQVPHGPLGTGLVCFRKSIPGNLAVFGKVEDWHKIPGKEAWVKQIAPCTHDGLKRADDKILDGYEVEFENGTKWIVPRVLSWSSLQSAICTLPNIAKLSDSGEWYPGEIVPRYRELWERFKAIELADSDKVYEAEIKACVAAMQTHYFVSDIECSLMECFSKQTVFAIWNAATDQVRYEQLKKNSEQSG